MVATLVLASGALAQNEAQPSRVQQGLKTGGRIAAQPVHDVDARRTYGLAGTRTCAQLASGIAALNDPLGPDFAVTTAKKENKAGKLAEAGGKTVVNAIIPFRGLVREISGAAPAQRRLADAIDGGYARRGFLRGFQAARNCRR
jgi:hypothetical protein